VLSTTGVFSSNSKVGGKQRSAYAYRKGCEAQQHQPAVANVQQGAASPPT
jgi:hypothetical protein